MQQFQRPGQSLDKWHSGECYVKQSTQDQYNFVQPPLTFHTKDNQPTLAVNGVGMQLPESGVSRAASGLIQKAEKYYRNIGEGQGCTT